MSSRVQTLDHQHSSSSRAGCLHKKSQQSDGLQNLLASASEILHLSRLHGRIFKAEVKLSHLIHLNLDVDILKLSHDCDNDTILPVGAVDGFDEQKLKKPVLEARDAKSGRVLGVHVFKRLKLSILASLPKAGS